MTSAHAISFEKIDGGALPLSSFAGKAVLVANVASACGFTPQYGPLQALWAAKRQEGLVVLGVPCNDFGAQEPGGESQIKSFCETSYGVTFPMTAKVSILAPASRHPFYAWLAAEAGEDALPRWNFHKVLIGRDGALLGSFPSRVRPDGPELDAAIRDALA
jgi:glutathione peroxidase